MKVNYHNENYKSSITYLIFCTVMLIFFVVVFVCNGYVINALKGDILAIVFQLFVYISFIILIFIGIKDYKKRKQQRDINLYIIQNGVPVESEAIQIRYVNNDRSEKSINSIIAEVQFYYNGEKKSLAVNGLLIKVGEIEKYQKKQAKIYILDNMTYIDIVN